MFSFMILLPLFIPVQGINIRPQGEILMDLYDTTNGDNWVNNENWGTGDPCIDEWARVECDFEEVNYMYLGKFKIQLIAISCIGKFASRTTTYYSDSNNLNGTVPSSIRELTSLRKFVHGY